MKTRVLTAIVALPVIIATIIAPLWWREAVWAFVALAGFALGAGLFEFYSLTKKLELKADAAVAFVWSAALFVGFVLDAPTRSPDLLFLTISAFVVALLVKQTFRFQADFSKMLTGIGVMLLGVMYIALLLAGAVAIFSRRDFK